MSMYKILGRNRDCLKVTSQGLKYRSLGRGLAQVIGNTKSFTNTALKTPKAVQQFVDHCGLEGTGCMILRPVNSGNFRKILFLLEVRV